MLETLVTTVETYIEQHQLLPPEGEIIVAVSGGADSLCLLHVLHRLCGSELRSESPKRYPSVSLHVAHLNHGLRREAGAQDAAYVAQIAANWGLPCTIGEIDVPSLAREERRSLEDAARVARYRFLREVAQGRRIAVAHHADDQAETLLLHRLRGEGLSGMVGMLPRQQDIIRPLLEVSHAETVAYCEQHHLVPMEDASNADSHFLRNRIRHELLPLLATMNPGIRATLRRNAEVVRVDLTWIEEQVDHAWQLTVLNASETRIELAVEALAQLPLSIQRHLMRRISAQLSGGQSPLELRHHLLLEQFLQNGGSGFLDMPDQLRIEFSKKSIVLERLSRGVGLARPFSSTKDSVAGSVAGKYIGRGKPAPLLSMEPFSASNSLIMLPIPGQIDVPGTPWRAAVEIVPEEITRQVRQAIAREDWPTVWQLLPTDRYNVYIDEDTIETYMGVRTRQPGDRIQPLGMAHEKKVQDVMVDRHIPRAERALMPLFFAGSRCIWVAGICIDVRVKLTSNTCRIIHLSIEYML